MPNPAQPTDSQHYVRNIQGAIHAFHRAGMPNHSIAGLQQVVQQNYDHLNQLGYFRQGAGQQQGHQWRAQGIVHDPTQGGAVDPNAAPNVHGPDPYGDPAVSYPTLPVLHPIGVPHAPDFYDPHQHNTFHNFLHSVTPSVIRQNAKGLGVVAKTAGKAEAVGLAHMIAKYGDAAAAGITFVTGNQPAHNRYLHAADVQDAQERKAAQPLLDIASRMTGTAQDVAAAAGYATEGRYGDARLRLGHTVDNTKQAFHDDPFGTVVNGASVVLPFLRGLRASQLAEVGAKAAAAGDAYEAAGSLRAAARARSFSDAATAASKASASAMQGGPVGRAVATAAGRAVGRGTDAVWGGLSPEMQDKLSHSYNAFQQEATRQAANGRGLNTPVKLPTRPKATSSYAADAKLTQQIDPRWQKLNSPEVSSSIHKTQTDTPILNVATMPGSAKNQLYIHVENMHNALMQQVINPKTGGLYELEKQDIPHKVLTTEGTSTTQLWGKEPNMHIALPGADIKTARYVASLLGKAFRQDGVGIHGTVSPAEDAAAATALKANAPLPKGLHRSLSVKKTNGSVWTQPEIDHINTVAQRYNVELQTTPDGKGIVFHDYGSAMQDDPVQAGQDWQDQVDKTLADAGLENPQYRQVATIAKSQYVDQSHYRRHLGTSGTYARTDPGAHRPAVLKLSRQHRDAFRKRT